MARVRRHVEDFRLPANFTRSRIERDDKPVGRRVEDQISVDPDVLLALQLGWSDVPDRTVGYFVRVRPDAVAIGGIDRDHAGARFDQEHDAVVDDRRRFLHTARESQHPGEREFGDVAAVDPVERTEPLLIESAVDHEPVRGIRIQQHLVRDGIEVIDLAERRCRARYEGDDGQPCDRVHDSPLASCSCTADSTG